MHFSPLFIAVAAATLVRGADNDTIVGNSTVALNATDIQILANITANLTAEEYYGAAIPPWGDDGTPGWYYGDYPEYLGNLTLPWLKDGRVCWYLDLTKSGFWCPDPENSGDGYTKVFSNYTGAVEGSDYLTYGLVDTVDDCKDMCDSVDGCVFINPYHDVNGKGGSPLLTCSLFSKYHNITDATNLGGQTQPDGSIDYITDSEGYYKD
ncbi:hypothetical protein EDD18DRAFT_864693 [Armillaria luteobubalina]|uniref:Apple domain-containing protein n=1 Tax=Armillaria luteobubalina TaxID=153913 RepID=A0AA39QC90_9AGAR|nr:hypothetical protein EDD18DRAFT_864693 [Armillaria luteobubalina]